MVVLLPDETATRISEVIQGNEKSSKEDRRKLERILLDSDEALVSMTFCRDSDLGRFLKGIRGNLETAEKAGVFTKEESAAFREEIEPDFAFLQERGVGKDDVMHYWIGSDGVRAVYAEPNGNVLLDTEWIDARTAQAFKAPTSRKSRASARS